MTAEDTEWCGASCMCSPCCSSSFGTVIKGETVEHDVTPRPGMFTCDPIRSVSATRFSEIRVTAACPSLLLLRCARECNAVKVATDAAIASKQARGALVRYTPGVLGLAPAQSTDIMAFIYNIGTVYT